MSNKTVLQIKGLQDSNNLFTSSPPGSLFIASNMVISQANVLQPRQGQAEYGHFNADPFNVPYALTDYRGIIYANVANSGKYSDTYTLGYFPSAGDFQDFGASYPPVDVLLPTANRMKFTQSDGFVYFCANQGPYCIEDPAVGPRVAGLARMPDCDAEAYSHSNSAPGNVLPYNSSIAYQTVLKSITSTGVPQLSPPSARSIAVSRYSVPIGSMARVSNVVTAHVVLPIQSAGVGIAIGDTFTLSPGEANFAAATYTVTGVSYSAGVQTITWASTAANATSTVTQELNVGPRNVVVQANLPSTAKAGQIIQIYRSRPTALSTVDPLADTYLCGEVALGASEITAGFVVYIDTTPDSVINVPLYTNPSDGDGQGAAGGNFAPPIYRDSTVWNGQVFYANTTDQQQLRLEILGVGPAAGIQDGDTITITDLGTSAQTVLTFKNSPTGTHQVPITSAGLPDYNIQQTGLALTRIAPHALALDGNAGIGIYTNSGDNVDGGGLQGKILLERTDHGAQFCVQVSRVGSWTPAFTAPGTRVNSDDARVPNGVEYSKLQEAEAVPAANFFTVGSRNYRITRIIGLTTGLLVFKDGEGIFSVTGSPGNFNTLQISTANCIAPDTVGVYQNSAWAYTDQGIGRLTPTSADISIVSRPIEVQLNQLYQANPLLTEQYSFAVAYEVERRIMFYVPVDLDADGVPLLEAYAYSEATQSWTRFNAQAYSGVVGSDRHLYLGIQDGLVGQPGGPQGRVTQERKTGTYFDYADITHGSTITAVTINPDGGPDIIELQDIFAKRGDGILQGQWYTTIVAHRTDLGVNYYEVAEQIPWTLSSVSIVDAYPMECQFLPTNPVDAQVLTESAMVFQPNSFSNLFGRVTLFTDQMQTVLEIPTPSIGYGGQAFGDFTWGDPCPMVVNTTFQGVKAAPWAKAAQHWFGFRMNEVWVAFKLQGVQMSYQTQTAPVGRGK